MEKKITMIDLAKATPFAEVHPFIRAHYPKTRFKWQTAYDVLKRKRKVKPTDDDEIVVTYLLEVSPSGIPLPGAHHVSSRKYSLSFRKWAEVGSLPISREALGRYSPAELLAHFIWELTYMGMEPEAKKEANVLMKRVSKLKNQMNNQLKETRRSAKKIDHNR